MNSSDRQPAGLFSVLAATASLALVASPVAAATFFVQQTNAGPGDPVDVCIWMSGGNNDVAGVQMDLTWDPSCMVPAAGGNRPRCRSNPDTGKTVQSAPRGASTVRAIMLSFSDVDPIPDGELFCCQFQVTNSPPTGQCTVGFSNLIASTPTGTRTDARGGTGGAVMVGRGTGGVPAPPAYDPYEAPPAPAPDAGRGTYDEPAAPAPGGDVRAAEPDAGGGRPGGAEPGSAEGGAPGVGGAPGQFAGGGQPGAAGLDAAGGAGTGYRPGEIARAEGEARSAESGSARDAAPAAARDEDDEDDEQPAATATPATPTPEAAVAQAATPTRPPATPTQAQPTATPTVASGWLGGCTLMRP